jgi:hypothetical protein
MYKEVIISHLADALPAGLGGALGDRIGEFYFGRGQPDILSGAGLLGKLTVKNFHLVLGAASVLALFAGAARADVTVFNSAPTDGWQYGTGNGYAPANTADLNTVAGDQLSLRLHDRYVKAPASVGDVYSFALGAQQLSYDWGIDIHDGGSFDGVTALLTFTNAAGGSFSYSPLPGTDNSIGSGHQQNSYYMNNFPGLNFNPLVDGTYTVNLTVNGLAGGSKSLDVVAQLGNGFAGGVPEPTTWGLMLVGFGGLGAVLRRRRGQTALTA